MTNLPGICIGPISTMNTIFLRDLITADNLVYGLYRENLYFTAMNVPSSLLSSFIAQLFPTLEYFTGYKTSAGGSVQCSKTFPWNLRFIMVLSGLLCSVLYYVSLQYPLTTAVSSQLTNSLQLKEKEEKQTKLNDEVVENNEVDRMTSSNGLNVSSNVQHLSKAEIYDVSIETSRLGKIFLRNMFTSAVLITSIVILFISFVRQLKMIESKYIQLIVSALSLSFIFFFYESLRFMAIYNIYNQPSEVSI